MEALACGVSASARRRGGEADPALPVNVDQHPAKRSAQRPPLRERRQQGIEEKAFHPFQPPWHGIGQTARDGIESTVQHAQADRLGLVA